MIQTVVLDVEGFKSGKGVFHIKELGLCTEELTDCLSFKPPNCLTLDADKKECDWITENVHGLEWDYGSYDYSLLKQIFQSIKLRFAYGIFYAKGVDKCRLLSSFLKKEVYNLEEFGCPEVENLDNTWVTPCLHHFIGEKRYFVLLIITRVEFYSILYHLPLQ